MALLLVMLAFGCKKQEPDLYAPFVAPAVEVTVVKPKPRKRKRPAPPKVVEPAFGDPDSKYGIGPHGEGKIQ